MENVRLALVDYDAFSRRHTNFVAEVLGHKIIREVIQPEELVDSIRDIRAGELDIDIIMGSTDAVNNRSARLIRALGSHVIRYDPPTTDVNKLALPTRRDIFQLMDELEEHPEIR